MATNEILPAPVLTENAWEPTKFERERHAFRLLMPAYLDTHEGKYLGVHNEQVVEIGDDQFEVARAVWKRFGYCPIYVGRVSRTPEPPIRLPSPRIARRSGT